MKKLKITLAHHEYPIFIGGGLFEDLPKEITEVLYDRRVFIVADEDAYGQHGKSFHRALSNLDLFALNIKTIQGGENAKSFESVQNIVSWFLDKRIDRQSVVIAIGGGVIGDVVGFAAAIVQRGVDYIQVPTTILAMVDSAVGGKTGINMPQGKNLVGAFHQPVAVLANTDTLKSLPEREIRAGYAEIVKYGLINDKAFFIWLEREGKSVLALENEALAKAVETSCSKKAEIVQEDEKETGDMRALLNLGHTFGHALERLAGYDGSILHGEAVSIGMSLAFRLSVRLGYCSQKDFERVVLHLKGAGLPVEINDVKVLRSFSADQILQAMQGDKKAVRGRLRLILVRGIGQAFVTDQVDLKDIEDVIRLSQEGS